MHHVFICIYTNSLVGKWASCSATWFQFIPCLVLDWHWTHRSRPSMTSTKHWTLMLLTRVVIRLLLHGYGAKSGLQTSNVKGSDSSCEILLTCVIVVEMPTIRMVQYWSGYTKHVGYFHNRLGPSPLKGCDFKLDIAGWGLTHALEQHGIGISKNHPIFYIFFTQT